MSVPVSLEPGQREVCCFDCGNGKEHRVYYKNKSDFDSKLQKFRSDGASGLSVIADFDFTLTKFWREGENGVKSAPRVVTKPWRMPHFSLSSIRELHKHFRVTIIQLRLIPTWI